MLTVMIILGAIWANIAQGSLLELDPKETAALVTPADLRRLPARPRRPRLAGRPLRTADGAGLRHILFTYFGNLFFGGLHAYA